MLLSRLLINHNHQRNELNISDFCIWVADNQNRSQLRPYKICHKSHHLLLGLTTVLCQLQDPLNEIAFPHLLKQSYDCQRLSKLVSSTLSFDPDSSVQIVLLLLLLLLSLLLLIIILLLLILILLLLILLLLILAP